MTVEPRGLSEGQLEFSVVWPDDATVGAPVVSHFGLLGDGTPQGLYLVMGQAAPPPWFSEQERNKKVAEGPVELQVNVRSAVFLTRPRAEELYALLGRHLGKGSATNV